MKELIAKFKLYGPIKFFGFAFNEILNKYYQLVHNSYSQSREDLIIDRLLNQESGFYVDVGAYDPFRFSNTKRFYDKGWRGINIEPDVDNYEKFLEERPDDINLNCGVSDKKNTMTFYKFFPGTLSTFSEEEANKYVEEGYELVDEVEVEVLPLSDVLHEHAEEKTIDFISIDTEGFDLNVLKSNDWDKFRPKIICIESKEEAIESLLVEEGYTASAITDNNSIYMAQ